MAEYWKDVFARRLADGTAWSEGWTREEVGLPLGEVVRYAQQYLVVVPKSRSEITEIVQWALHRDQMCPLDEQFAPETDFVVKEQRYIDDCLQWSDESWVAWLIEHRHLKYVSHRVQEGPLKEDT